MSKQYPNLHIVDHPLVQHKLSIMRNKEMDKKVLQGDLRP